jgi:mevalonate pyrophosphate decarboxylase
MCLQEDLQAKIEECDQISERLKESEELSKLARSSSGSAEPSQVSRELAGGICLTCKDSNVAKLQADLEKEQAATQELQEQLSAANSTVAQLQVSKLTQIFQVNF